MSSASNKALLILLQQPNISREKKQLIQRELLRRNKNNYGYELSKMFGVSPPPTNKIRVSHANVMGRIVKQSGTPLKQFRVRFAPEHTGQFMRKKTPKVTNPQTRLYRIARKVKRAGLEMVLLPIISNRNPKIYKNTEWRYKAGPVEGGVTILYNNRNSVPFIIDKKTGRRKPVPPGVPIANLHLFPRNMKVNTLNAYSKRVNQLSKKFKSLQKSNAYATGRSPNKPANSSMRYYFRTHPRPLVTRARTPANIQRSIKESIQSNLFEYINVPNRNNLRQKWQNLTNRDKVNTIKNLVKKMRRYRRSAGNTLAPYNERTFNNLYNRALTRNQYGFYYR
jgi:hypothetical protein